MHVDYGLDKNYIQISKFIIMLHAVLNLIIKPSKGCISDRHNIYWEHVIHAEMYSSQSSDHEESRDLLVSIHHLQKYN